MSYRFVCLVGIVAKQTTVNFIKSLILLCFPRSRFNLMMHRASADTHESDSCEANRLLSGFVYAK